MRTSRTFLAFSLLLAFAEAGAAESSGFEEALLGNISAVPVAAPSGSPEAVEDKDAPAFGRLVVYDFYAERFPGFYEASHQNMEPYNIPEILKDVPKMWKTYGELFKKVGMAMEMDPYALAAYCVFESYDERPKKRNYNTRHKDGPASGIASTQAQYVKGGKVPGLKIRLPRSQEEASEVLRDNPEYGLRFLSAEFKAWYYGGDFFIACYSEKLYYKLFPGGFQGYHDLAKSFPRVASPAWTDPDSEANSSYRTQPEYVSRAYVLYKAFRAADKN